jgi:hypothetical protein
MQTEQPRRQTKYRDSDTEFDPGDAQRLAAVYSMATGAIVTGKFSMETKRTTLQRGDRALTWSEIRAAIAHDDDLNG